MLLSTTRWRKRGICHERGAGEAESAQEEVLSRFEGVAALLRPFRVEFRGVEVGSTVFQCVYLGAQKSEELMDAHAKIREAFDLSPYDFFPHLSLLYGDQAAERRRLASEWAKMLDVPLSSTISTLELWYTPTGDLTTWRRVAARELGPSA